MSKDSAKLPTIVDCFYEKIQFIKQKDDIVKLSAACKKCQKKITGNWIPHRVTSNFISHAKICTPRDYASYEKGNKENRKRSRTEDKSDPRPVTKFFKPKDRSDLITDAISHYLIKSMRPISEVENAGFVEMFQKIEPQYVLPTRKTMRARVLGISTTLRNEIISLIEKSSFCAVQCDIWSSRRMHGFLGLCLTMFENPTIQTRLIACRRFTGPHTAENISNLYSDIMNEYNASGKVCGIVTDNAANMIKAFPSFEETDESDEYSVENDNFERLPINWNELHEELSTAVPVRYSCVAHTLQLVVKDGLAEASTRIQTILKKCSSIVASIHKSCKLTELLESHGVPSIPMQNATRWNSTYAMIDGVVTVHMSGSGIFQKISEMKKSHVILSPKDFEVLVEMKDILQPFDNATKCLQTDNQPTSGMVIPTIIGLMKSMERLEVHHISSVKAGLQCSLKSRFETCRNDMHMLVSSALDPRFKLKWIESAEEGYFVQEHIKCQVNSVSKQMNNALSTPAMDNDKSVAPQIKSHNDLFGYMEETSMNSTETEELQSYLDTPTNMNTNCISFWEDHKLNFPCLYQLHLQHHIIPATSAAIERSFSAAGFILNDRRNRLDDILFESLLLAKCNSDII